MDTELIDVDALALDIGDFMDADLTAIQTHMDNIFEVDLDLSLDMDLALFDLVN